jgi:hypothetical protein
MRISKQWRLELEREFEQDTLIDLSVRLRKGSEVTLTPVECAVLADNLNMERLFCHDRRRDRHDYDLIALTSFSLEARYRNVEAAVTRTARMFGVSRTTVFEARQKQKSRYSQK